MLHFLRLRKRQFPSIGSGRHKFPSIADYAGRSELRYEEQNLRDTTELDARYRHPAVRSYRSMFGVVREGPEFAERGAAVRLHL